MKIVPRNYYDNLSFRDLYNLPISNWKKSKLITKKKDYPKWRIRILTRIMWYFSFGITKGLYENIT